MSEPQDARDERVASRSQVELGARPRDEGATAVSRPEQPDARDERAASRGQVELGAQPRDEGEPLLRIITPGTTPEEVAAIVAVLSALGGGQAPAPRRTPEWNRPSRLTRGTHRPGPGAWRASGLPR